ncbi:deoxyribodipyrimidine photo-lyase (single-stranded DNA-specific) [Pricia antarctica]|uniref:Cryptochrome DASH n=1 Tax=Pricia antarctica TaxID=641691 RepID=A0A1G7GIK6_9FLAO|nr:DASH family cryptochrome [Pricia antarctica]SDE87998.1 deoxyribodipyrimidine photo-lyase (single-stranded DNA-specific) [Pricia antarctica]
MNNLIWFRNDLRVADNSNVSKACQGLSVMAVYFFDPRHYEVYDFGFKKTEKYRARFLIDSVTELKANLLKLNITLLVFHDRPENVMPNLVKEQEIKTIYLQKEWTRDENKVLDAVISKIPASIHIEEGYEQFLFHPDDIPYSGIENIPQVFTQFRKKCEKYSEVRSIMKTPSLMPKNNLRGTDTIIPSLKELGLSDFEIDTRTAFPFKGGEEQALKRVHEYFWETKKLGYYKKTRNGLLGKDYSSKLSPWLANGSISPRTVYWEIIRFEKEIQKNNSTYWLIFELIWRDYFKYVSLKHGSKLFKIGGILNKEYLWNNSTEAKRRWISGDTTEPFVNANMKEIAATGWMSNRGRQNVASFWAKELQQDWRIGAAYFESLLLDYDVHSNWGNWMYNSGVGNDPRDRKFNIQSQAERYDGQGKFQNLWLQERLF